MVALRTHPDSAYKHEIDWSLFTRKPLIIGEAPVPLTDLSAFPLWEFTDETRREKRIQPSTRKLLKSVFPKPDKLFARNSPVQRIRAEELYGKLVGAFELENLLHEIQRPKDSDGRYYRPTGGDPFDVGTAAKILKKMLQDVDDYNPSQGGAVPKLYGRFVFMFGRSGIDTFERAFGPCDLSAIRNQSGHAVSLSGTTTKNGVLAKTSISLLYHFQRLQYASTKEEVYAKNLTSAMLQAAYNRTFPNYEFYMNGD